MRTGSERSHVAPVDMIGATTEVVASIDVTDRRHVDLGWVGGMVARANVLWLRDNCPSGGDKRSGFRTFSVGELDPDLRLDSVTADADAAVLRVRFSDGHESVFSTAWLREFVPSGQPRAAAPIRLWRSDAAMTSIPFDDLGQDEGRQELLSELVRSGAALVTGVPTSVDGTEGLASCLGHVRETDFGRLFDIISEPDVWTMSQSTNGMDPHTDDPFRYTPSGASVLHCVEASTTGGGASTLVDGFSVADRIRREQPDAFELLCEVAVPWIRYRAEAVDQGESVNMQAHAPIIRRDKDGDVCGIRFHERSMGVIDADPGIVQEYYEAFICFARLIRDPEHQWAHLLRPGEALVFDNQRVLHGRTPFTGDPGRRHLRLCTVDRDQVHSTLRRLIEDLGLGDHDVKLPAGNLS